MSEQSSFDAEVKAVEVFQKVRCVINTSFADSLIDHSKLASLGLFAHTLL